MADIRIENEIKFWSDGGPFSHDGVFPGRSMERIQDMLRSIPLGFDDYRVRRYVDTYYRDADGTLSDVKAAIRIRAEGDKRTVTLKKPYVHDGLGLSRREFQTEVAPGDNPMAVLRSLAAEYAGVSGSAWSPILSMHTVRCECALWSDVRRYKLSFDRFFYRGPEGSETFPNYEIEVESIDAPIKDDSAMTRLTNVLEDKYLFEEQRMTKLARGIEALGIRIDF